MGAQLVKQVGGQVGQVGGEVGRQVGGQVGGHVKGQIQDGGGAVAAEMHLTKSWRLDDQAQNLTTWALGPNAIQASGNLPASFRKASAQFTYDFAESRVSYLHYSRYLRYPIATPMFIKALPVALPETFRNLPECGKNHQYVLPSGQASGKAPGKLPGPSGTATNENQRFDSHAVMCSAHLL